MTHHLVLVLVALLALGAIASTPDGRARVRKREARKQRQREYRSQYLKSEGWSETRSRVLERARGFCEDCGARKPLDVHHLTYKRKGHERLTDLRAICRGCHTSRHRGKRTALDYALLAIRRRWRIWRYRRTTV